MQNLNLWGSLASIVGLFFTIWAVVGIKKIQQYYYLKIRLPKLKQDLKRIKNDLMLLNPNDDKVMDLLGDFSACVKNLKLKKIHAKDCLLTIKKFKENRTDTNFLDLRYYISELITALYQHIEDDNAKGNS